MRAVGIAEMKANLSGYVKAVRDGQSITVLDRKTPVAQLIPFTAKPGLRIRKPAPSAPRLGQLPRLPPLEVPTDIVSLLMEERDER